MSTTEAPLDRPLVREVPARFTANTGVRRRKVPTPRRIRRHRLAVSAAKWLLPLLALILLGSIAVWPEIVRITDSSRVAFRRALQVDPESGRMLQPRYRGVDQRGRPYTVTAATAQQTSAERVALTDPKGDTLTESGTWLMGQAKQGVFIQRQSLMDLSQDVFLYREDGTVLQTDTMAMDLKAGAATSSDKTHAEGPFGTLDAQGFTLVDKGAVIQFDGESHAVLNGAEHKPAPETSK